MRSVATLPSGSIVALLFCASGVTGLVYEVVWSRSLQDLFGVSTHAITIVVAAYMAGLALGSALFARFADRLRPGRALAAYGMLELAIGLFALVSQPALDGIAIAWRAVAAPLAASPGPRAAVEFLLAFTLLLIPTTLMGGTLPLISRCFAARASRTGSAFGAAYALNTLGAVGGTLLAGFVLLEQLGLGASLQLVALVNLAIGTTAIAAGRRSRAPGRADVAAGPASRPPLPPLLLAALLGFASLACQILWVRGFGTLFLSTTYTFALVLAVFLAGIALGAALGARLPAKSPVLAALLALFAFACLSQLAWYPRIHDWMLAYAGGKDASHAGLLWRQAGIVLLVVGPLTLASGAAMPVLVGMLSGRLERTGHDVGWIYVANTIGALFGAFAGGFLLVPWLGPSAAARLLAILVAAGILLAGLRWYAAIVPLAAVAVIALRLPAPHPMQLAYSPLVLAQRLPAIEDGAHWLTDQKHPLNLHLLELRHGVSADAAVLADLSDGSRALLLNGMPNGTTHADLPTQLLLAGMPWLVAPRLDDCVQVGLGTGITAGAWAALPGTGRATVVELEASLLELARWFAPQTAALGSDPELRFVADDARTQLALLPDASLDVVISQPSHLWAKGMGNLFTSEFFALARRKLRGDGLFVTWVMGYHVDGEVWAIPIATLLDQFAHVVACRSPVKPNDVLFLASRQPLRVRPERWHALLAAGGDSAFLRAALHWQHPTAVAAYLLADRPRLEAASREWLRRGGDAGLRNTEDHPVLEHLYPRCLFRDGGEPVVNRLAEALEQERVRIPPEQVRGWLAIPADLPGAPAQGLLESGWPQIPELDARVAAALDAYLRAPDAASAGAFVDVLLADFAPARARVATLHLLGTALHPTFVLANAAKAALLAGRVEPLERWLTAFGAANGTPHAGVDCALWLLAIETGRSERAASLRAAYAGAPNALLVWDRLHKPAEPAK